MIEIEESRMSLSSSMRIAMSQLLDEDAEAWASISGLMASLALPPVFGLDRQPRKRIVEIEIAPRSGLWSEIDGVAIEADRLVFFVGTNGHREEYVYRRRVEPLPAWRVR